MTTNEEVNGWDYLTKSETDYETPLKTYKLLKLWLKSKFYNFSEDVHTFNENKINLNRDQSYTYFSAYICMKTYSVGINIHEQE